MYLLCISLHENLPKSLYFSILPLYLCDLYAPSLHMLLVLQFQLCILKLNVDRVSFRKMDKGGGAKVYLEKNRGGNGNACNSTCSRGVWGHAPPQKIFEV